MNALIKISIWLGITLLIACTAATIPAVEEIKETVSVKADLGPLLETYHQEYLKFHPIEATYAGDSRYNDQFPNLISKEYIAKKRAFYANTLEDLHQFDKSQLSPTDQMSYEILNWDCEIALASAVRRDELTPVDQMWSTNLTMAVCEWGFCPAF